jgi:2-enoate reductase
MRCAVNPEVGREYEFHDIERAAHPKEVFIVGGGLAGMEAARISQLRGHRVTLFEKSDQLGGILNVGKIPPNKEMVGSLIDWYKNELERAGVPIHTGRQVNSEWLAEQEPDVVMVATGSEYLSNLPGADPAKVMHAVEALRNPERVGRKTIIIGGGATGCEVAEHLTRGRVEVFFHRIQDIRGELVYTKSIHEAIEAREITIIEMLPEICTDMDRFNKTLMQIRLKENNVKVLVNSQVHFLPDGSIEAINRLSGKKESLMADTIIIAFGTKPKAQDRIPGIHEVHYIGDASRTGKIIDAIYDGYCIARMI